MSWKRLAALSALVFFLATSFRTGWSRLDTDFPNYYTAAKLVRQGQALAKYYDWTWFAREMNYVGIERQLGAYAAQTPLTMLPMVPLTGLSPLGAKRVWLILNLCFLGITIWLLSRVTRFKVEQIWLLAFCGFFSLRTNFLYGQYYLFLLFLLTLGFYLLHRNNPLTAGSFVGLAFGLKLYGGPFLLFFAAKRQWKAVFGMLAASAVLAVLALVLFGWADLHYYATQILPRSLEGGSIDPYDPGVPTFGTMLRRLFMQEAELNPDPFLNATWVFFFLRTLLSLAIICFTTVGIALSRSTDKLHFAWFTIAVLMFSTSVASYTFILLLLPLMLLLDEAGPRLSALLVSLYVLVTLPLHPLWLFPKVWVLLALYLTVGWPCLRLLSWRIAVGMTVLAVVVSILDANRHMTAYGNEPEQHFARVAVQRGALFSSFPTVTRAGMFYQSIGRDRYVLRWVHGSENEEISFEGNALRPRGAPDGESIDFELVANQTSTMMRFDPVTRRTIPTATSLTLEDSPVMAVSPDGKWLAYETTQNDSTQISIRNRLTGEMKVLTGGNCNSSAPTWELDSRAILFASDCGRAFGLPALYRADIANFNRHKN